MPYGVTCGRENVAWRRRRRARRCRRAAAGAFFRAAREAEASVVGTGSADRAVCAANPCGACTVSASVTTRPQARGAIDRRTIIGFPALIRVGPCHLREEDMGLSPRGLSDWALRLYSKKRTRRVLGTPRADASTGRACVHSFWLGIHER